MDLTRPKVLQVDMAVLSILQKGSLESVLVRERCFEGLFHGVGSGSGERFVVNGETRRNWKRNKIE